MLKVLGRTDSINVRKVLWLLEELALPYEHEAWGSGHRSTNEPGFETFNPNRLVPVLIDDDAVLWESNTICRYLVAREGREDLLPSSPLERARVEQWMDWQLGDLNNAWRYAFLGLVKQLPAFQDPKEIASSTKRWNALMQLLDERLASGSYVASDAFTLADIPVGLCVNRWRSTPLEGKPVLAAVEAYVERLSPPPGWRLHGDNGMP